MELPITGPTLAAYDAAGRNLEWLKPRVEALEALAAAALLSPTSPKALRLSADAAQLLQRAAAVFDIALENNRSMTVDEIAGEVMLRAMHTEADLVERTATAGQFLAILAQLNPGVLVELCGEDARGSAYELMQRAVDRWGAACGVA